MARARIKGASKGGERRSLCLSIPTPRVEELKRQMPLPLEGIKIVEFAGLAPGPLVGLVLADFGADVIRIDKVGQTLNPDSLCRGKRSLAISPKHPKGLHILHKLISQADVVIDPFRPGVMERLGLGPEDVKQGRRGVPGNEKCIFARITGFQRDGEFFY